MNSCARLQLWTFVCLPVLAAASRGAGGDFEIDEETSLLQETAGASKRGKSLEAEDFVVTRGHIDTDAPGLAYRASMDLDDRDPDNTLSSWGSTVSGVPVDDDWLRVGARFLPMRVGGEAVLEQVPGALSVTQQHQPEGAEQAEGAEQEASEPEAAELEPETEPEEADPEIYEEEALVEPERVAPELEPFDGLTVQFGVLFRSFPVMDFPSGTFTASFVLTQRWPVNDAPSGDGEERWSPNLAVMNHDIGGVEAISTSMTVNETDGVATQVDYLTVRVRQTFNLKLFPFDQQVLSVHVAPASPGDVNMRLMPMHIPGERSLEPELLEDHGFFLVSVAERGDPGSDDVTLATPARGIMEVALDRRASAYSSSMFLPALLLLGICWVTFFLPFPDPSLATPRVAVTATIFLAVLVFNMHVEQMIPARFGRMWVDVFTENISILVAAALAFNTLEQYVHGHMSRPSFASKLSCELRVFYPALCVFVLGSCFLAPWSESLTTMSNISRLSLTIGIFGYIGFAYGRARRSDAEDKAIRSPR